jgi:hypothetical protein
MNPAANSGSDASGAVAGEVSARGSLYRSPQSLDTADGDALPIVGDAAHAAGPLATPEHPNERYAAFLASAKVQTAVRPFRGMGQISPRAATHRRYPSLGGPAWGYPDADARDCHAITPPTFMNLLGPSPWAADRWLDLRHMVLQLRPMNDLLLVTHPFWPRLTPTLPFVRLRVSDRLRRARPCIAAIYLWEGRRGAIQQPT